MRNSRVDVTLGRPFWAPGEKHPRLTRSIVIENTQTHTDTHTDADTQRHRHTETHTQTHTETHTQTHTHTHTPSLHSISK